MSRGAFRAPFRCKPRDSPWPAALESFEWMISTVHSMNQRATLTPTWNEGGGGVGTENKIDSEESPFQKWSTTSYRFFPVLHTCLITLLCIRPEYFTDLVNASSDRARKIIAGKMGLSWKMSFSPHARARVASINNRGEQLLLRASKWGCAWSRTVILTSPLPHPADLFRNWWPLRKSTRQSHIENRVRN